MCPLTNSWKDFTNLAGYELRRAALTRKYGYMLLAALFLACYSCTMAQTGVGETAPFSAPSVARVIALNSAAWGGIAALLCQGLFNERERAARRVLLSSPVGTAGYFAPKLAALGLALGFVVLCGYSVFGVYYAYMFGELPLAAFGETLLLFVLPALLFAVGLAMPVGRLHPGALYALFAVVVLAGMFNIERPLYTDWFGNVLYIDIEYLYINLRSYAGGSILPTLPGDFLIGRAAFAGLGVLGIALGVAKKIRG